LHTDRVTERQTRTQTHRKEQKQIVEIKTGREEEGGKKRDGWMDGRVGGGTFDRDIEAWEEKG